MHSCTHINTYTHTQKDTRTHAHSRPDTSFIVVFRYNGLKISGPNPAALHPHGISPFAQMVADLVVLTAICVVNYVGSKWHKRSLAQLAKSALLEDRAALLAQVRDQLDPARSHHTLTHEGADFITAHWPQHRNPRHASPLCADLARHETADTRTLHDKWLPWRLSQRTHLQGGRELRHRFAADARDARALDESGRRLFDLFKYHV
jgi:hypothetical protein